VNYLGKTAIDFRFARHIQSQFSTIWMKVSAGLNDVRSGTLRVTLAAPCQVTQSGVRILDHAILVWRDVVADEPVAAKLPRRLRNQVECRLFHLSAEDTAVHQPGVDAVEGSTQR
jgi:hypothetical protein